MHAHLEAPHAPTSRGELYRRKTLFFGRFSNFFLSKWDLDPPTHSIFVVWIFVLFLTLQSPLKWALYAFFFLAFPAHGDPLRLRLDAIAKSRCSNDGDFRLRGWRFWRDENDGDSVLMTKSWQVCSCDLNSMAILPPELITYSVYRGNSFGTVQR